MTKPKLPIEVGQLMTSLLDLGHNFTPNSDQSYKMFFDLKQVKGNAKQSIFTGSLFRNSDFSAMDFSLCDFEGVRVELCEFVSCNFSACDIRSAIFVNVKFVDCSFSGVLLDLAIFKSCSFLHCDFSESSITNSSFSHGTIQRCKTKSSTNLLNTYNNMCFKKTKLADCTFLFHIFKKCTFIDMSINADSLGSIYGIDEGDLKKFSFYFLGEKQASINSKFIIEDMLNSFLDRKWYLKYIILNMNLRRHNFSWLTRQFFETVKGYLQAGLIIQADELKFIFKIFQEKKEYGLLPIAEIRNGIISLEQFEIKSIYLDTPMQLNEFIRNIRHLIEDELHDLSSLIKNLNNNHFDQPIVFFLKLKREPSLEPDVILNKLSSQFGITFYINNSIEEVTYGSVLYKIKSSVGSILLFYVFLHILNGCFKELHEFRAHIDLLLKNEIPETYMDEAIKPEYQLPVEIDTFLGKLLSSNQIKSFNEDPKQKGYSHSNLIFARLDNSEDPPK